MILCNQVCPYNTLDGCKKDELNHGVCIMQNAAPNHEGSVGTICGIPIDEAMKILTIYKYANVREIGQSFVNGFEAGYKAAVDEMSKKLKESLNASFKSMDGVKEAEDGDR